MENSEVIAATKYGNIWLEGPIFHCVILSDSLANEVIN